MRTITFKGLFLTVLFVLLGNLTILAADEGLITRQITINLDKAGTLPDRISESQKYLITNLKIVGEVNGTDWKFIREMAGRDYNRYLTDGKLSILDLSDAKIVEGGSYYYRYQDVSHKDYYEYTSNDKLGDLAFNGCSGLTSLTLPSNVTSIRSGAFSGCSGLTSIYVCPEKLPELGENVFEGCDAKNCTVYVPKGTYDDYRSSEFGYFENIVKLGATGTVITKQITINLDKAGTLPGRISESKKYLITNLKIVGEVNGTDWNFIREMAGCDCKGNTTYGILSILDLSEAKIVEGGSSYIYIGDNIYTSNDKLGDCAFYGCKRLNSLTIPTSVTSIGKEAFSGCSGLNSLNIPTSVTSIGERAFKDCSRLASLTIPSSVTSIGEGAFSSCRGLTSLTIPSSVTWISNCTFEGCSGLTSLTIPSSVTSIGYYAFSGCSGLTSLTIPSSVTEIGCSAFKDCSGLTSIYVYPETSPALGANVFEGCDAKNCTVYVPKGTHDDYWLSDFGYFENLVEFDAAGIDKVTTSTNAKESSRYAVNGQRLSAPAKGLNIVKYSDGSVKKVAVQ